MKTISNFLSVIFLSLLFQFNAHSQNTVRCFTTQYTKLIEQKYPEVIAQKKLLKKMYYEHVTNPDIVVEKSSNGAKYVIPVVVHVIHSPLDSAIGDLSNIDDERIYEQIKILNEDYRKMQGTNGDGPGADMQIEFRLAAIDPNGSCTNGIIRLESPLSIGIPISNLNLFADVDSSLKALSHWDNRKYLNIYVVHSIDTALGYTISPYSIGLPALNLLDGVVIQYTYFGYTNHANYNQGRTTTHEVGHWMGLSHTFEWQNPFNKCQNDSCMVQGDAVCDTPPTDTSYIEFPCISALNTCDTDDDDLSPLNPFRPAANGGAGDQLDMFQNYMDYSDDVCMDRFTQGQVTLAHFFVSTLRSFIISDSNQVLTGVKSLLHDFDSVQVFAGLNGKVTAMTEWALHLVIAGDFTEADGMPCPGIILWDGDNFVTIPNAPSFYGITSLASYNDDLYVGGTFNIYDTCRYLAKFDGVVWDKVTTNTDVNATSDPVRCLYTYNGKLYVGGDFGQVDGNTVNANRIASWDGTTWSALGGGLTGNSSACYAMSTWNGYLVVGGRFIAADGIACDKIAFWDGSSFGSLNSGTNVISSGRLNSIGAFGGKLFAGGDYSSIGGQIIAGLSVYDGQFWGITSSSAYGIDRRAIEPFNGYLWVAGHIEDLATYVRMIYTYDITKDTFYRVTNKHDGFDNPVNCMTQFKGELYIGGEFTTLRGVNGEPDKLLNYICKVHTYCVEPPPTSIEENVLVDYSFMKLYPNPTEDFLIIENAKEDLRIFNLLGEEIYSQKISNANEKTEIDVSKLSSGIYFVKSGDAVAKFMKN